MFTQEAKARIEIHNKAAHPVGDLSPKARDSIREYLSKSVLPYLEQIRYYQQAEAEKRAEDTANG